MNFSPRVVMATVVMLLAGKAVGAQELAAPLPTWTALAPEAQAKISTAALRVPDSVRVQAGYQHWRGAGLGAAIGGMLGALTGAIAGAITSCYDCDQQPSAAGGALVVGLLGAGAGSVVGFLAGLSSPKYVWVPTSEAPR